MRWYSNPIARHGDFADPFVLRYNGRYYLYCTNPDVPCWTSDNLIDWQLHGPVIAPGTFGDLAPWAPEVCLYNGRFYMYTSPSGRGHYVLASDSPTGPFEVISENLGRSIDGHVFMDDDGRRYFYWAGDEGIWGCELITPTEFGPAVLTGAYLNGWTEGPFVVKHDNRYYMTLTGNHYLSRGYRVCAAVSDHPLKGYRMSRGNPVLISTTGHTVGLGHSSTVLGPDLVSHWIVYHNLNPDRSRDLNIDRQIWHGDPTIALGPSQVAPAPTQPDYRTGNEWITLADDQTTVWWQEPTIHGVFTSEHNIWVIGEPSSYGIVGQMDDATSWAIRIDPAANRVNVHDGSLATPFLGGSLPAGYTHNSPHCWHLIRGRSSTQLVIDGRLQLTVPNGLLTDRIGYEVTGGAVKIGYTALTCNLESTVARDAVVPMPGRFSTSSHQSAGEPLIRRIVVPEEGRYDVFLCGEFPSAGCLTVDRQQDATVRRATVDCLWFEVSLQKGLHELCFVSPVDAVVDLLSVEPASTTGRFELSLPVTVSEFGKQAFGDPHWHDFKLEASVTIAGNGGHGDLLFRATQMSEGGEGDDAQLGINFLLGYSVQLHDDRVILARHAYDEHVIAQATPMDWCRDSSHKIGITARGISLSVMIDGVDLFEVRDENPYQVGQVGIRASGCGVTLSQLTVVAD